MANFILTVTRYDGSVDTVEGDNPHGVKSIASYCAHHNPVRKVEVTDRYGNGVFKVTKDANRKTIKEECFNLPSEHAGIRVHLNRAFEVLGIPLVVK